MEGEEEGQGGPKNLDKEGEREGDVGKNLPEDLVNRLENLRKNWKNIFVNLRKDCQNIEKLKMTMIHPMKVNGIAEIVVPVRNCHIPKTAQPKNRCEEPSILIISLI